MTQRSRPRSTCRDGVPSRPVILADGDTWGFALPTVRYSPAVAVSPDAFGRPVERVTVEVGFGYPLEIQRLIDGFRTASELGTAAEQYAAFFTLAAALLRRAHDLDLTTACELLEVSDADLAHVVNAALEAISGSGRMPSDVSRGDTTA
jgi:hypothetical protein